MRPLPERLALALYALWLPCCGEASPTTAATSDAGASATAAGQAAGGADAGAGSGSTSLGGSAGASAGQASAGSSAGAAVACASYGDDAAWSLQVHIKNEMTQTLYLGPDAMSCGAEPLFQIEDGARTVLPSLDSCRSSCSALMQSAPVACPNPCATPTTITLEPGQSMELPWDGRFAVEQTLPQQCLSGSQQGPAGCVRAQQVKAGAFTFSARAGTRRDCSPNSGTCGACTPNPTGGCSSPGSLIAGTIYTTELLIKLEPGELSPGGAPQYIGLLFQDQPG